MKFKRTCKTNQSPPNPGETRTVIKFAWFPVSIRWGLTVWLERYIVTERYDVWKVPVASYGTTGAIEIHGGWKEIRKDTLP